MKKGINPAIAAMLVLACLAAIGCDLGLSPDTRSELERAKNEFVFESEKARVMADNPEVPLDDVDAQIGRMVKAELAAATAEDRDRAGKAGMEVPVKGNRSVRCRVAVRRWEMARRAMEVRGMDLSDIDLAVSRARTECD